jgi:hypothetical protein
MHGLTLDFLSSHFQCWTCVDSLYYGQQFLFSYIFVLLDITFLQRVFGSPSVIFLHKSGKPIFALLDVFTVTNNSSIIYADSSYDYCCCCCYSDDDDDDDDG